MSLQPTKVRKTNTASSDGGTNAEDTNSLSFSSENQEFEPIENTPFGVLRIGKDWFVTLGNNKLSVALKSKEEALKDAERNDWLRICQVMEAVYNIKSERKWEKA